MLEQERAVERRQNFQTEGGFLSLPKKKIGWRTENGEKKTGE